MQFWKAIARGLYPEAAVAEARVSWVVGARWFWRAGGMPPTHLASSAPPLSSRYLSFAEREQLALLRAEGHGVRACGRRLGRAPSTISRALRRNAATRSGSVEYTATTAQWHADRAAARPKPATLAVNAPLRHYVQERLASVIATPTGQTVPGPTVAWSGRTRGRRGHVSQPLDPRSLHGRVGVKALRDGVGDDRLPLLLEHLQQPMLLGDQRSDLRRLVVEECCDGALLVERRERRREVANKCVRHAFLSASSVHE